ncbi:MAG: YggS family pyridoxal phosphate-dependent enzyme [Wenzhouxiangellaceae bacterium]|nr:YggS family pyridoxal phosphate-dependent enzyme [Wenzhouxiangellaceae bacterium]
MPTAELSAEALAGRAADVERRIDTACRQAGRARAEVTLLAVSKTRSADEIRRLCASGQTRFGENYADEALAKQQGLADLELEWHYIGPVQSNKTRMLAGHFDWIQSVDRNKIIQRLADQRPAQLPPINILLQVNIDREPQKSGCDPADVANLACAVAACRTLRLRGLMAIPSAESSATESRSAFAAMRALFESLRADHLRVDTLSMGMSADLEAAIAEGSTMVRVGTALFGPRIRPNN